jgi:hypothetical protein
MLLLLLLPLQSLLQILQLLRWCWWSKLMLPCFYTTCFCWHAVLLSCFLLPLLPLLQHCIVLLAHLLQLQHG